MGASPFRFERVTSDHRKTQFDVFWHQLTANLLLKLNNEDLLNRVKRVCRQALINSVWLIIILF